MLAIPTRNWWPSAIRGAAVLVFGALAFAVLKGMVVVVKDVVAVAALNEAD